MTRPLEDQAYRSQRRFIFAVTLALVILLPIGWFLFSFVL
jgi:hypothetical protein